MEGAPVDQLALHGGEEALGDRIIETGAGAAGREAHASLLTPPAEGERGILTTLVAVMNYPGVGAALSDRHRQRVDDQLGTHVLGHRPTNDPAREDDREVEKSHGRRLRPFVRIKTRPASLLHTQIFADQERCEVWRFAGDAPR